MGARRGVGVVLLAAGLGGIVVGLIGVLGGGGGTSSAAGGAPTSPTTAASPSPTAEPSPSPTAEPSPSPTAEPTEEPAAETPEEFFAALGSAFADGDVRFLLPRLHPFVLDRYGEEQCRASLGALDVPDYAVEVLAVQGDGSYVYETDDVRRRVHGATTVRVRFTEDGETFVETDVHVVLQDGRYRWLTDCGTPVAGAP